MTAALDYGSTVIGVFNSHDEAENAIRNLKEVGFEEDHIGIVDEVASHPTSAFFSDASASTATFGALVGLGVGTIWGLGILLGLLPGFGTAFIGGTFGALVCNAAIGTAIAGLLGAMMGLGASDQKSLRDTDDDHLTRTIVTVKSEDRADTACAIMNRYQQKS
ncbi:hypothetical protein [Schlesneria paludicola]|uniref:hypothetical protein n=1 Tax=Schlesneria paludicola TaxID=360056 RepID=UPI00029AC4AD|nr:hypothetical protein [Schlesneria paludicola]